MDTSLKMYMGSALHIIDDIRLDPYVEQSLSAQADGVADR